MTGPKPLPGGSSIPNPPGRDGVPPWPGQPGQDGVPPGPGMGYPPARDGVSPWPGIAYPLARSGWGVLAIWRAVCLFHAGGLSCYEHARTSISCSPLLAVLPSSSSSPPSSTSSSSLSSTSLPLSSPSPAMRSKTLTLHRKHRQSRLMALALNLL